MASKKTTMQVALTSFRKFHILLQALTNRPDMSAFGNLRQFAQVSLLKRK